MHKQHNNSKTQCPSAQINTACWCLISQESSFINNASASVARITQNKSPDPEGIGNTAWPLLKCIEKLDLQSVRRHAPGTVFLLQERHPKAEKANGMLWRKDRYFPF